MKVKKWRDGQGSWCTQDSSLWRGAWIGSLRIACPTVVSWGRSCPTESLHPAPSGGWEPLQPLSSWAYPACLAGLGVDCKAEVDWDEAVWVRITVVAGFVPAARRVRVWWVGGGVGGRAEHQLLYGLWWRCPGVSVDLPSPGLG